MLSVVDVECFWNLDFYEPNFLALEGVCLHKFYGQVNILCCLRGFKLEKRVLEKRKCLAFIAALS